MDDWRWRYPATMVAVIDGDTFDVQVDQGFSSSRVERVRLLGSAVGVNAAEMHAHDPAERALALAARDRVIALLPAGAAFQLRTKMDKRDGFRRYLGEVILDDGRSLGDVLLAEGLARVWTG